MLTIPVIQECAHTENGRGVIHIDHAVLKTVSGAVWDHIEWLVILLGTRSKDGLTVHVKDIRVPLQYRGTAHCELVEKEDITPDVVGVLHSHHNMFAGFSHTDNKELNPRFPMSIVVAQPKGHKERVSFLHLGFQYQAEGKAILPCGNLGIVPMTIQPHPLPEGWPEKVTVGYTEPKDDKAYAICPHMKEHVTGLSLEYKALCGVVLNAPAPAVFGKESTSFMAEVREKTRQKTYQVNIVKQHQPLIPQEYIHQANPYNYYPGDDDFLKHWSVYE